MLEISVLMAQFPSKEIARLSYDYRTLGLGYANIGGLLMTSGIPYDSPEGRAICGALTAIMTGVAYATSAEMAGELGAFPAFERNRDVDAARHAQPCARRARPGRTATRSCRPPRCRSTTPHCARPEPRRRAPSPPGSARVALGEKHGYRNAQATVIAPTGTIGLVMDCDTTGIEPDFALVKFKKLAGGGYFKIINRAVPEALTTLGYAAAEIDDDRRLRGRPRHAEGRARHQPRHAEGQGLHRREDRRDRERASPPPSTSNSPSTNGRSARSSAATC